MATRNDYVRGWCGDDADIQSALEESMSIESKFFTTLNILHRLIEKYKHDSSSHTRATIIYHLTELELMGKEIRDEPLSNLDSVDKIMDMLQKKQEAKRKPFPKTP